MRKKLLPLRSAPWVRQGDLCCLKGLQSRGEWRRAYWLGPTFGVEADFIQAGVRSLRQGHRSDLLGVLENY